MNAFIIITMVSNTLAHYIPNSDSPNVGTVLFTPSDLKKRHWSKTSIALLQARKYLQNIIPSPQLTGSINEEYITNLLNYFENSYKTVKRETKYPSLRNVMDVALSDALGGYLKIWVLPITKYAYYGGTVSLDSSLKIFEAYEDIKRSLKTDGRGWRSPNKNLLNSVAINIISLPSSSTRSKDKPCEQLAYYEKTDAGIKIPMPYINWDIDPPTMFLPLVNQSIISLSSPSSSSSLLKYYTVADKCTKTESPKVDDFYKRFQKWLSDEVAPHLNDDKLYAGFGSILSLMNSTKQLCSEQIDNLKEHLLRDSMTLTWKKFLIIALILIIELVWCIPTIIYTMCLRKRKMEKNKNNQIHRLHKSIESMSKGNPNKMDRQELNINHRRKNKIITPKQPKHGLKLFVQPKTTNLEVDVQFPSNYSKLIQLTKSSKHRSFESNFSHYDLMTLVNEDPNTPILNTTSNLIVNSNTNNEWRKTKSEVITNVEEIHDLKLAKTFTLVQNSEKTIKEITYSQENIGLLDKNKSNIKCDPIQNYQKITKDCLNVACIKDIQNEEKCKVTQNEPRAKRGKLKEKKTPSKTVIFSQTDTISEKQKGTMVETNKIRVNSKKECELRTSDQPTLRILIERPQNSIKVGITSFKGTTTKPSKIPKAVASGKDPNNSVRKTTESSTVINNNSKFNKKIIHTREYIIRGKALDDSAIKQTTIVDKKLNLTL
ncbi:uncharacterized protein LOC123874487 [Maniola jurtina]|uniref:uncharacterized protein LOC123874487 n=1 Tax=Maniola jurtina TaxID=191418 RepID=UPI001E689BAB|nr:uncharacterized protein LOC123874487 [Maniola jurtina]